MHMHSFAEAKILSGSRKLSGFPSEKVLRSTIRLTYRFFGPETGVFNTAKQLLVNSGIL